jgi:hypothetical protein
MAHNFQLAHLVAEYGVNLEGIEPYEACEMGNQNIIGFSESEFNSNLLMVAILVAISTRYV